MGTRAQTFMYENGHLHAVLYRQFDGSINHARELLAFLSSVTLVHSYGPDVPRNAVNGAGGLFLRLLRDLPTGDAFYTVPALSADDEDFGYHINVEDDSEKLKLTVRVTRFGAQVLAAGSLAKFSKWVNAR